MAILIQRIHARMAGSDSVKLLTITVFVNAWNIATPILFRGKNSARTSDKIKRF